MDIPYQNNTYKEHVDQFSSYSLNCITRYAETQLLLSTQPRMTGKPATCVEKVCAGTSALLAEIN